MNLAYLATGISMKVTAVLHTINQAMGMMVI